MIKNVASIHIQKVATFNSDRKIINSKHRLFFEAFVYGNPYIQKATF